MGRKNTLTGTASSALAGQLLLSAIADLVLMFAPRSGDAAVLLFPLTKEGTRALPSILSEPGTRVIARGRFDGSYTVRGVRPGFLTWLSDSRIFLLSASAPGCGPLLKASTSQRSPM